MDETSRINAKSGIGATTEIGATVEVGATVRSEAAPANFQKNVVYRCIGDDFNEGVIACGYMQKPTAESNQENFVIGYYSAFLLLSGSGTYIAGDAGSDSGSCACGANASGGNSRPCGAGAPVGGSLARSAGDPGDAYPITPGCFVQRFPGRVHTTRIHPNGQWLEFFVSFGRSIYTYMQRLGLLPQCYVSASGCDSTLRKEFDAFIARLSAARDDELPLLLPDIQKLVMKMSRPAAAHEAAPGSPIAPGTAATAATAAIQSACTALSSDFTKDIDLYVLSRQLRMSYESFRKLFKKATGTSPARYRCNQRIKHAQLLLSSGISIKETAEMVGYGDIYAFTKQFTKTVGVPPGEYVQQLRRRVLES